jgi:hypothetical protein
VQTVDLQATMKAAALEKDQKVGVLDGAEDQTTNVSVISIGGHNKDIASEG